MVEPGERAMQAAYTNAPRERPDVEALAPALLQAASDARGRRQRERMGCLRSDGPFVSRNG